MNCTDQIKYIINLVKINTMKYIYLLPLLLFSCNNKKEKDRQLIEFNQKLNEKNKQIQRRNRKIKYLEDELENCKMNYKALDQATE